ncbi:MAG: RuBisCO large subunit C-terminal-like domain-containing protein [Rubrivivax sp.]
MAGTRKCRCRAAAGPLVGTIIKPNVGLSAAETARWWPSWRAPASTSSRTTSAAATPSTRRWGSRIRAVMAAVRAHREATGKTVLVAVNISDEHDAMLRHAELLQREGGACAMVSLNWTGHAARWRAAPAH